MKKPDFPIKMPLREFFNLPKGAKFLVTWAKDDDYKDGLRLSRTLQTVRENTPEGIYPTDRGYEWLKSKAVDFEDNQLETGRGIAYVRGL
jgi:hypothetical protein